MEKKEILHKIKKVVVHQMNMNIIMNVIKNALVKLKFKIQQKYANFFLVIYIIITRINVLIILKKVIIKMVLIQ